WPVTERVPEPALTQHCVGDGDRYLGVAPAGARSVPMRDASPARTSCDAADNAADTADNSASPTSESRGHLGSRSPSRYSLNGAYADSGRTGHMECAAG